MVRRVLKLLTALSLALCLLASFLWIRSTWKSDSLFWDSNVRGSVVVSSYQHALHWNSQTPMEGTWGRMPGIRLYANSCWVPDDAQPLEILRPLHHGPLGIGWMQTFYDDAATDSSPARRVRVQSLILPFPLIAVLSAIVPGGHKLLRWKNRRLPKRRTARLVTSRRTGVSVSLLACAIILYFLIRSLAFGWSSVTFMADRIYSVRVNQHLSAFVFEVITNPNCFEPYTGKGWSIECSGYCYAFGTTDQEYFQSWQGAGDPGPRQLFPAFHYARVDSVDNDADWQGNARPAVTVVTRTWTVPFWFILPLAAAYPLKTTMASISRRLKGARRARRGLCQNCGFDLRATPARCPECGVVPKSALALPAPACNNKDPPLAS